jgi:hypothetical protein
MICKALQGNNILTQLSMAKNDMTWGGSAYDDMSAVIALCKILPDMGVISSVTLLKNGIGTDQAKNLVGILKEHPTLKSLCGNTGHETELDLSGKMYGNGDPIMLVPEIIDNRAISSVNLLKNNIPIEQAKELVKIMQSKEKLITLCGLSKEETELDFSGQGLCAADTVLIANDISDMRALSVLSLKSNDLQADGGKALAEGLKGNQVITELNIADNNLANGGYNTSGVIALADVISDMGAMTSLNLASNMINSEGAKHVAEAIKVSVLLRLFSYNTSSMLI